MIIPPEIVEKVIDALTGADLDRISSERVRQAVREQHRAQAERAVAAVSGDLAQTALESAMEGNALARAVGWDDGYLQGRRDALTEAVDAITTEDGRSGTRPLDEWTRGLMTAARIVTDLRAATAPEPTA